MGNETNASRAFLIVLLCTLSACYDDSAEQMPLGRTKAGTDILCSSLKFHRDTTGSLPTESQGLEAMIEEHRRSKTNTALMDGWKRPMHPVISGNLIIGVYSAGPNGKYEGGSGDDIACEVEGTM